jgi:hypothetical protein
MALFDERVEIDHLGVVVKEVDHHAPAYPAGQGRDGCECRTLRHVGLGPSTGKTIRKWDSPSQNGIVSIPKRRRMSIVDSKETSG